MIDVEALAVPAFLAEVPLRGGPADVQVNAAARMHPDLLRCLSAPRADRRRGDGDDPGPLAATLRACAVERSAIDVALATAGPDGRLRWRASLAPLTDAAGRVAAILGVCREVALVERDPTSPGGHLSLALQAIHGAEWRYDVGQGAYQGSDEMATLLGEASPRPVTWAEWLERVHPQDLGLFLAKPSPERPMEFRFHGSGGQLRWARCSCVEVTGLAGEVETVLGVMIDITEERVRETAWAELATHDPLTGLLNRRGLRQAIDRLQADLPPTASLALFALDLDHFKATNDDHGHAAGDAVLVEASRRLAAAVENRVCARLGGDEFVAILPVSDEMEAHRLRDRLWQEFRRPLAFRGRWLPVSASIGVACVSGAGDAIGLMDSADADLYLHKAARGRASAVAA